MRDEFAQVTAGPSARRRMVFRFSKYSLLSLLTVPVGYSLLLFARHRWNVNAGVLNLAVGMVLTPPSFLLYRQVVWGRARTGRGVAAELFSFWQTVMVGAIASSVIIAVVDAWFPRNAALIVLSGMTGQGLIFIARFLWLDKVTFSPSRIQSPVAATVSPVGAPSVGASSAGVSPGADGRATAGFDAAP